MASEPGHMRVLQMIDDGQISAAEGLRLLDALSAPEIAAPDQAPAPPDPGLEGWRRWWLVPMWVGIGVVLVGSLLMYGAYQSGGVGFWFACAAVPFIAGVLIMALAASSRSARWLHLRVHNHGLAGQPGRNIALSFPLPIRFSAWLLRTFGSFVPQLKEHGLDELILALAETASPSAPLYLDVDEGGGERVQVYIG